jgi:type II secretory pathway pseudopilin PulG
LRRTLFARDRRSEEGDTLIEVLVTLIILSGCAVALLITFGTSIAASVDHRNLAVNDTVLRNLDQTAFYQLDQQPSPLFAPCTVGASGTATTTAYSPGGTNAITFTPPTQYSVAIGTVQFWNGVNFVSTCPAPNAPQLVTLTVNNPNGSIATTQTVVEGIGVPPTIVSVTGVSPASASQGTSDLLLTITGTGFSPPVSDSTVTFPSGSQITVVPGTTTFVSPTTITVSVNIAAAAPAPASYPISVTNQGQATVTSKTNLFTVRLLQVAGMHVGSTATNIADPAKDDPDESTTGWDAWLTLTVVSGSGAPLQGAVINGSWNLSGFNGNSITTSCTTDGTGSCTVYIGYADQLPHNQSPLPTFTLSTSTSTNPSVGGIVLSGYTYDGSGGSWTVPVPT